jgi:hypothetical protein
MQFEQLLREVNREIINPEIEELSLEKLRPIAQMVARSRAVYLKRLYELAQSYKDNKGIPTAEEMIELKLLRERFIDLADGSKSIEISIQRGYLDLKS